MTTPALPFPLPLLPAVLAFVTGLFAVPAAAQSPNENLTRDPTIPPPAWLALMPKQPGIDDLIPARVQVMVVGKSRRIAIVDGQVVHPGDTMFDTKVADIQSNRVVLEDDTKSLRMTPNIEKTAPATTSQQKKQITITGDSVPSNANRSNP